VPRGAYHFVYWCRPWQEEMAWFEQNVPVDPDALPPVLDVEATPESRTCKRTLTRESVVPEMRAMLQRMQRHYGKKPIIYVTVDFYQAILPITNSATIRSGSARPSIIRASNTAGATGPSGNISRTAASPASTPRSTAMSSRAPSPSGTPG
jgi:hypothetical protein